MTRSFLLVQPAHDIIRAEIRESSRWLREISHFLNEFESAPDRDSSINHWALNQTRRHFLVAEVLVGAVRVDEGVEGGWGQGIAKLEVVGRTQRQAVI